MVKTFTAVAIAVLAVGAAPEHVLTVRVSGSGTVRSRPAGIDCRSRCTLRAKAGAKITLTASPKTGAEFSHWSKPCGRSFVCTVKMTAAKTVRAYFKPQPAPPPPPTPPPPAAKAGHYNGAYTDGSTFDFDVQAADLTNLMFDFNGHCSDGSNLASPVVSVNGTFPIGSDGAVSGTITLNYSNGSGTANFAGKLTSAGAGSGTMNIDVQFDNGGPSCSSTGTWTAQDQS